MREHRLAVSRLRVDGEAVPTHRNRQPRVGGGKARMRAAAVPGHRHSAAVAARLPSLAPEEDGVLARAVRQIHLFEPELLALVEEDLAGQAEKQQQRGAGAGSTHGAAREPRHGPHHVVVGKRPGRLRAGPLQRAAVRLDRAPPERCVPRLMDQGERHVELVREDVFRMPPRLEDLAHEHAVGLVAVGQTAPAAVDVVELGLVDDREGRVQPRSSVDRVMDDRPVGEILPLEQGGGHVDPKAVGAPVQPELQDAFEFRGYLGVPPVQVGLLGREEMEIPAVAARLA